MAQGGTHPTYATAAAIPANMLLLNPEAVYVSGVRRTDPRPAAMSDDDDRTPMTRTELAMLWDGLGRWIASGATPTHWATVSMTEELRDAIDAELTERFGG